ncbi:MAG: hypothetical protein C0402_08265 [Thermodesulfovibrio sp.]|nr:hypothetical protein [Thermodesulfovibrio sp.]
MGFKIAARTILQLGAELISSDAIAFYELIKNAFDADSPDVRISVIERIPYSKYRELKALMTNRESNLSIQEAKENIISAIAPGSPKLERLQDKIEAAKSWDNLQRALDSANYIRIQDCGEGMSLKDLQDVYLTIGTRSRYLKRQKLRTEYLSNAEESIEESIKPVLGEKGVGRLSVMRLGDRLRVRTKKAGEKYWNFLEIDWSRFSHESDLFVEDISVAPWKDDKKANDADSSGTVITVSALKSRWSTDKLREISTEEFRKLIDPFTQESKYPILLEFNDKEVKTRSFDKLLYEMAHARVSAEFRIDQNEGPMLSGKIDYLLHKKQKKFKYYFSDLKKLCDLESPSVLRSLGPFKLMFYWYNKRLIKGIDGWGTQIELRDLINQWAGGIMVFRDGFRVLPYGGADNDWLDLDKKAWGSSGFKLNRQQVIGKATISSIRNPMLIDQTNREGLVRNDEKETFVTLLKIVLFNEFKLFTLNIDREMKLQERLSFRTLEKRLEDEEERLEENLSKLVGEFRIPKQNPALKALEETKIDIIKLFNRAKDLADIHEDDRTKYLNLAGIGLMAEIIAHELSRASLNILNELKDIDKQKMPASLEKKLETFEWQLKTLQKRLKMIDPVSTRGRQVKETFNLVNWIDEILYAHKAQFKRHAIRFELIVVPEGEKKFYIKAVKGMIVQIMENLIANSVYWLKAHKEDFGNFKPEITVIIDTNTSKLFFTDNGPGISPERREEVFQPFFSTKPFKLGRGLGLYISKEIAEYNNSKLYLSDEINDDSGNLNTFVLEME